MAIWKSYLEEICVCFAVQWTLVTSLCCQANIFWDILFFRYFIISFDSDYQWCLFNVVHFKSLYISNLKKVSFIALSLANSLLRINKECHKVVNLLFVTVQKSPPMWNNADVYLLRTFPNRFKFQGIFLETWCLAELEARPF